MIALHASDNRTLVRWLACGAVVLGAHVGGAAVLANWPESAPPGGATAIAIELAPVSVAPATAQHDVAVAPTEELHEPAPEKTETQEDTPQIEKPPEVPQIKAAVPLPIPDKPKPQPKPKPKTAALEAAPAPAATIGDRMAAPRAGRVSNSAARANWRSSISAHLNRFKRFPSEARNQKGRPVVAFTLDRSGQVLSSSLVSSSGVAALDQEAVSLARRAAPFPPPPPDEQGATFAFRVPVDFY
jgi:protein TonB